MTLADSLRYARQGLPSLANVWWSFIKGLRSSQLSQNIYEMEMMHIQSRSPLTFLIGLAAAVCLTFGINLASAGDEDEGPLQRALERFVSREGGPPGIVVVVTRGKSIDVHTAGYANLESKKP